MVPVALADWACTVCGSLYTTHTGCPEELTMGCLKCSDEAGNSMKCLFRRVWSPVGVGKVDGAGGSPSR